MVATSKQLVNSQMYTFIRSKTLKPMVSNDQHSLTMMDGVGSETGPPVLNLTVKRCLWCAFPFHRLLRMVSQL